MQGQNPTGKPSLLRAFLLSMAGVAVLFSLIAIGVWIYTTDVLTREERLINELLPELDAAHQLTAATAGLQSQGLLLRSSRTATELKNRRVSLDMTIGEILKIIDTMKTVELSSLVGLRYSVDSITDIAIGLADVKAQQIDLQARIRSEMQVLLSATAALEKEVQQQVVVLTEQLLDINQWMEQFDAANSNESPSADLFNERIFEYETISLAIQDYLLFSQDVVSLSAVVERVPLLKDKKSVDLALQNRDLLISALVSRSIYITTTDGADALLTHLRSLRSRLRDKHSLFIMEERLLSKEDIQDELDTLLRERTAEILRLTEELRNDSSVVVSDLAAETLAGLDQYRRWLVILSAFALFVLGTISYWLLYRKTVVPLIKITQQLDDVGSHRFPSTVPDYSLKEMSALSSATMQLDAAQKNMQVQDRQLQGINDDLQRANEELQQFAHIASHDLQEPLRKMQQFSDLLEEDYGSSLDEDARFFIKTIRSSAQRMSVLIKETLEYSRSGSSNQKLTHVALSPLLQQLCDEMDLAIQEAQGELLVDAMPVVLANELGMAQLFRNLMINSLKYRKPGTPARIHISVDHVASQANGSISIHVEDNGIGIPAKYLQKIFIPFERLHAGDVPGTGLGLAICKKVCESHRWRLEVSSEPQVGTAFVISIPKSSVISQSSPTDV